MLISSVRDTVGEKLLSQILSESYFTSKYDANTESFAGELWLRPSVL